MPLPKPLFMRWSLLTINQGVAPGTDLNFECSATNIGLTTTGGDAVSLSTLCPDGSFSETNPKVWNLAITAVQDVESTSDESLMLFLMDHEGEAAHVTYYPKTDNAKAPVGRGWEGDVTLGSPNQVGNVEAGNYATFDAVLPFQGKPVPIGPDGTPIVITQSASAAPQDADEARQPEPEPEPVSA
jgi:hypothetical protein